MSNIFEHKKPIKKIILGLGNTSLSDIKAIGAIYAKAGVDMFDITADKDALTALFEGIKSQNLPVDNFDICTSFSFGDDIHGSKAQIDKSTCKSCGKCIKYCPYNAISDNYKVVKERCIGCRKCSGCECISYYKDIVNPVEKLRELSDFKIDTVELHTNGVENSKIVELVKDIHKNFPNIKIGICNTFGKRSISETKNLIKEISSIISPQKLIFQADGKSMSGVDDELYTAKEAVDFAKELQEENIYIILSGGCNSKTNQLVESEQVNIHGIGYGSYARILVDTYVKNSEFWCNMELINQAVETARKI